MCVLTISRHYYVLDICPNFTALTFFLFFLTVISPHTSWVLLLLICHTFILSSLIFCPYYLYPAQLDSTPSSFLDVGFLSWKVRFSILILIVCWAVVLAPPELTAVCLHSPLSWILPAHASSFSGCSHLSPLRLLLGRPESLVIWSSENPYCFPSASPRLFLIPQGSCSWYYSDGGSSTPIHLLEFLRIPYRVVLL